MSPTYQPVKGAILARAWQPDHRVALVTRVCARVMRTHPTERIASESHLRCADSER